MIWPWEWNKCHDWNKKGLTRKQREARENLSGFYIVVSLTTLVMAVIFVFPLMCFEFGWDFAGPALLVIAAFVGVRLFKLIRFAFWGK